MSEEPDQGAPASVETPEPVTVEETTTETPVTDTPAQDEPSQEAPVTEPEISTEATSSTDDVDPFAEFETDAEKNLEHYENLFKSEKWKHVPHAARDEIRALVQQKEEVAKIVNELGGQPVLDVFKPTFEAVLNPNPTSEQVEAAFEAINDHNPQIMQKLGEGFTKQWVNEVVADPVTNLTPLLQHTFAQVFGPAAASYDLNRVLEFIQLDMARDTDGDPILDLETARSLFDTLGGHNAFRHQQEKAEYERRIQELQNGYKPQAMPEQTQTSPPNTVNVDADLETDILPQAETLLGKLGYAKTDAMYGIVLDALKYRARTSPEADRIRAFASNGVYKNADGKFVQGVTNNRTYLAQRLRAQLINDMKAIQSRRVGTSPTTRQPATTQAVQNAPAASTSATRNTQKPMSIDELIADVARAGRQALSDESAQRALAAGN